MPTSISSLDFMERLAAEAASEFSDFITVHKVKAAKWQEQLDGVFEGGG